jgi:hypothetical protein
MVVAHRVTRPPVDQLNSYHWILTAVPAAPPDDPATLLEPADPARVSVGAATPGKAFGSAQRTV